MLALGSLRYIGGSYPAAYCTRSCHQYDALAPGDEDCLTEVSGLRRRRVAVNTRRNATRRDVADGWWVFSYPSVTSVDYFISEFLRVKTPDLNVTNSARWILRRNRFPSSSTSLLAPFHASLDPPLIQLGSFWGLASGVSSSGWPDSTCHKTHFETFQRKNKPLPQHSIREIN